MGPEPPSKRTHWKGEWYPQMAKGKGKTAGRAVRWFYDLPLMASACSVPWTRRTGHVAVKRKWGKVIGNTNRGSSALGRCGAYTGHPVPSPCVVFRGAPSVITEATYSKTCADGANHPTRPAPRPIPAHAPIPGPATMGMMGLTSGVGVRLRIGRCMPADRRL